MKHSTKKWLAVAGGLALCAVLVFLITGQFTKEPPQEAPLPTASSQPGGVVVQNPDASGTPESSTPEKEKDEPVMKPEIPAPAPTPDAGGGAVSSGTNQTIQADPVKPTLSPDALKDPTQKPDGTPVEGIPTPEDHNNVTPPVNSSKENDGPQGGDTNSKGQTYLPGFGWIDNSGENQAIQADDMYENGNKIGIMD